MKEKTLDRMIRRIRNSGWLFHESDDIAERSYHLLLRLKTMKHKRYPYRQPVDRFGNTAEDRAVMAKNGLCQTDFM